MNNTFKRGLVVLASLVLSLIGGVSIAQEINLANFTEVPEIYKTDLEQYNKLQLEYPGKVNAYFDSYGVPFFAVDGVPKDTYHDK